MIKILKDQSRVSQVFTKKGWRCRNWLSVLRECELVCRDLSVWHVISARHLFLWKDHAGKHLILFWCQINEAFMNWFPLLNLKGSFSTALIWGQRRNQRWAIVLWLGFTLPCWRTGLIGLFSVDKLGFPPRNTCLLPLFYSQDVFPIGGETMKGK